MAIKRHIRVAKWRLKRRLAHFETSMADLLYGRVSARERWLSAAFLGVFEGLFRLIVRTRWRLYNARLLKQQYLGCQVLIIGNITVGGTGKTPVVEHFAKELTQRGRKVAILSRGYKRKGRTLLEKIIALFDPEANAPTVVSDGHGRIRCDWKRAGDEPYMLASSLPNVAVVVDKDRVKAGSYAIEKFGVDTLILDDGFQYYPLRGQTQVCLIDQTNPFGNGSMLPRGILREPTKALRRADFVFITKSDGVPSAGLLDTLHEHAPHAKPIVTTHAYKKLVNVQTGEQFDLNVLRGKDIVAFSGIATPETFERGLEKLGAQIVKKARFADHYAYDPEDLLQIYKMARTGKAEMIVTTQKDAVRLPALKENATPVYYLRLEIEILKGQEIFELAMQRICVKEG